MIRLSALILATLFFSSSALALDKRCDYCSTSEMKEAAISLGEGQHYIYSLPTRDYRNFNVLYTSEPGVPNPWLATYTAVTSGSTYDYLDALSALYFASSGTMKEDVTIEYEDLALPFATGTVFDMLGNSNMESMLRDKLKDPQIYVGNATAHLNTLLELAQEVFIAQGYSIYVTVVFSDGSTAQFVLEDPDGNFAYVEGSARTEGGQQVPESPTNGTWLGEPLDNLEVIQIHMAGIGATVASSSSCKSREELVCKMKGNGTYSCTLYVRCQ